MRILAALGVGLVSGIAFDIGFVYILLWNALNDSIQNSVSARWASISCPC